MSTSATVIGHVKKVERLITGLHSFDRAFINQKGEVGFPLGKITEIYGPPRTGKSTMVYGLSGILASELESNIALADLEDFDPDFLISVLDTVGFTGTVNSILFDNDEDILDKLIELMWQDYAVGILDAVGTISPIAERKGDIGDAVMGRRAKIMAQFTRKAMFLVRSCETSKCLFLINHVHPRIGGRGYIAPGGETKSFLSSIRINVRRKWRNNKEETFPDGSYVVEGTVKKNSWGLENNKFHLFVLAGKGIHKGLTALYDGIIVGKVDRAKTIKIEGKSFGYLKNIVQEAQSGNSEFFQPFIDILEGQ